MQIKKIDEAPHARSYCHAKTRYGSLCKNGAMLNGRCRMHGGKSTGPKTDEGRSKCKKSRLKHGLRSKELRELVEQVDIISTNLNDMINQITQNYEGK